MTDRPEKIIAFSIQGKEGVAVSERGEHTHTHTKNLIKTNAWIREMTSETNKNKSVLKIIISEPGNSNKYCGEMKRKKKRRS